VGAQVSGEPITVADTLAASFNVVPAALLFGGLSVLAFGAVPRVTAYVAFGGAGAAFVIQLLAGLAGAPSWLGDLSPFSHLAAVPAVPVNTAATLVMLAVAVASTAAGMAAFRRRDLLVD
jgi:ABC-2 type transport system permease protein